jgi:integrase/recombinase XerD
VLIPLPPAVGRALDRAIGDRASGAILLNRRGARMDRHAATAVSALSVSRPVCRCRRCIRTCSATPTSRPCSTLAPTCADVQIAARHADPRTTMRYDQARNNLDRHPNYILAAYMASGTLSDLRLPRLLPRETSDIADERARHRRTAGRRPRGAAAGKLIS